MNALHRQCLPASRRFAAQSRRRRLTTLWNGHDLAGWALQTVRIIASSRPISETDRSAHLAQRAKQSRQLGLSTATPIVNDGKRRVLTTDKIRRNGTVDPRNRTVPLADSASTCAGVSASAEIGDSTRRRNSILGANKGSGGSEKQPRCAQERIVGARRQAVWRGKQVPLNSSGERVKRSGSTTARAITRGSRITLKRTERQYATRTRPSSCKRTAARSVAQPLSCAEIGAGRGEHHSAPARTRRFYRQRFQMCQDLTELGGARGQYEVKDSGHRCRPKKAGDLHR